MKTYYDVLNLEKTCSSKEIKDSFIKLSKLYHPDRNKNSDAHKKFVEVNEAYSVLGKADSRNKYDSSLLFGKTGMHCRPYPASGFTVKTPYEHYAKMYSRNMRANQESGSLYFTTRRLKLLFFCCFLLMVGSGIQLKAEMIRRKRMNQEIAKYLKELEERKKNLTKEQRRKEIENRLKRKQKESSALEK